MAKLHAPAELRICRSSVVKLLNNELCDYGALGEMIVASVGHGPSDDEFLIVTFGKPTPPAPKRDA